MLSVLKLKIILFFTLYSVFYKKVSYFTKKKLLKKLLHKILFIVANYLNGVILKC